MRVDADGESRGRPHLEHGLRLIDLRVVFRREDDQAPDEARRLRPRDDGLKIVDELAAGQMAMRVDHRGRRFRAP